MDTKNLPLSKGAAPVGEIGYGLMGLTWRPQPQPAETSFNSMRTALSLGANFWNGGELYGTQDRNSCHLLAEYFAKYPEDSSKIILSIKGGLKKGELHPDGSETNINRSINDCLSDLKGTKPIDIFQCARVDPAVPIEETVSYLAKAVRDGRINGIGLSEVRAETIRRAHKIHPIAAVEVELSLWATDILRNGVAATCHELGIPVIAYSPLARGALTDSSGIKSNSDIPENDFRRHLPKFQDDVLAQNNRVTEEVEKLAKRKGCTKAQIAINWVRQLSGRTMQVPGGQEGGGKHGEMVTVGVIVPIPGSTTEERVRENCKVVELSEEEMGEIEEILKKNPVVGDRYPAMVKHLTEG